MSLNHVAMLVLVLVVWTQPLLQCDQVLYRSYKIEGHQCHSLMFYVAVLLIVEHRKSVCIRKPNNYHKAGTSLKGTYRVWFWIFTTV